MNKRRQAWIDWTSTYWNQFSQFPELFPFVCKMYANEFRLSVRKGKKKAPKKQQQIMQRTVSPQTGVTAKVVDDLSAAHVLFVPQSVRPNYLGILERVATRLSEESPEVSKAFLQTKKNPVSQKTMMKGTPFIELSLKRVSISWVYFFRLYITVLKLGLPVPAIRKTLLAHPISVLTRLVKIAGLCSAYRSFLNKTKVKVLVTTNETLEISAHLFPVAKSMGIKTVQILHGAPSCLFSPFISDEFFVWSQLTQDMIGTPEEHRLKRIGSIEHDFPAEFNSDDETPVKEIKLLFLSQICGDRSWGISAFAAAAGLLAQFAKQNPDIKVRVRRHPVSHAIDEAELHKLFNGTTAEIKDASDALEKDIEWASHIYSASSTAIFSGLCSAKPCYLVWNDELDEIHGAPFFPEEYVVTTTDQIKRSIGRSWNRHEAIDLFEQITQGKGATLRAVLRIKELIQEVS